MCTRMRYPIALVWAVIICLLLVASRGEAAVPECEDLAAPSSVEIENTACGDETDEISPVVLWQPVDNTVAYLWEVVLPDGTAVDTGIAIASEVEVGPLDDGTYVARVQAQGDGEVYCDSEWAISCTFTVVTEPEPVSFTWWPEMPKAGERVRFADLIEGTALSWFWDFGDGFTSDQQHPTHTYDEPGGYITVRDVELDSGHVIEEKTITVAGVVECGNNACESGETAWSCPADCALGPEETGRAGGSDHRPTVPAAAGGLRGESSLFWTTQAWVHNPGSAAATVIPEFTASAGAATAQAGPFTVEPGQSLLWEDAVQELFGSEAPGALKIDSSSPVLFFARTSTGNAGTKAKPDMGSVGQDLVGIRERLTLGQDDGALYLLGLLQGGGHSSWLHAAEVDGSPVTARVDVFNNQGRRLRHASFAIPGGAARSIKFARLGLHRGPAYAAVRVTGGTGRLAVSGTVVDHSTGDQITVPALHGEMANGSKSGESHQLVAVAFHRNGQSSAVWRSGLAIANPTRVSQTIRLVYESEFCNGAGFGGALETVLTLRPRQQLVWSDVLSQLFGLRKQAATQGSLHLFHSGELLVDSRVFAVQRRGGAVGSGLPALGAGDMIRAGETGVMIGLAHAPSSKTHLGLSEFSGRPTDVQVALYATGSGPQLLGTREFTVPASAHLTIKNLFEAFGLNDSPVRPIVAEVTTVRGGSVYPYAMTVNKKSGDPAIHLAARK